MLYQPVNDMLHDDWYYLLPEDHDKLGTILEDLDAIDCLLAEAQKIAYLSEEK